MSTYTAKLIKGRSYQYDSEGNLISATETYSVRTGDKSEKVTLDNVSGLPTYETEQTEEGEALVPEYSIQETHPTRWEVEVTLRTETGSRPARPPSSTGEISRGWTTEEVEFDLTHDMKTGAPVLNSAGQPFDSVPTVPRVVPVIRVEKFERTSGVPAAMAKSGCVNSAAITVDGVTVPARCGRLRVSAEKQYRSSGEGENVKEGYRVTYELAIMSNMVDQDGTVTDIGWDVALVDMGFFYRDSEGELVRAMELDEETNEPRPTAEPVLLDGSGGRLVTGNPKIGIFHAHPEANLGGIF